MEYFDERGFIKSVKNSIDSLLKKDEIEQHISIEVKFSNDVIHKPGAANIRIEFMDSTLLNEFFNQIKNDVNKAKIK